MQHLLQQPNGMHGGYQGDGTRTEGGKARVNEEKEEEGKERRGRTRRKVDYRLLRLVAWLFFARLALLFGLFFF